ncbi:MAG: RNA-binding cell elongation regulator Jag/EloR [Bacillota bacterium]
MKSGEFTGHSIDEAVFHGLQELGLSIDEVRIETLQSESKGLFGIGAKLARVRLTQREEEIEPFQKSARTERPERNDRPERRNDRNDRGPRSDRGPQDKRPERRSDERVERQNELEPQQEQYDFSAELAQSHPAGIFLSGLLQRMDIDSDILAAEVEDGVRFSIQSKTKGLLIGRRGETLDALQYLTSLVVNRSRKQEKYLRVTLDTEDYRNKREDTLIRLARRQAARVKSTGRPVAMEPMNPYERRVLHASLQNNPYVTTHSEGEEPNRRVVITPKK